MEALDQRRPRHAVPENRLRLYHMRDIIETLADMNLVVEIQEKFGICLVIAFMRVEGRPAGVIANNPHHLADERRTGIAYDSAKAVNVSAGAGRRFRARGWSFHGRDGTMAATSNEGETVMAMRILWPNLPAQLVPVATEAIGPGFETEFREKFEDVTDEQWANADAVVGGCPPRYIDKLRNCRIFVKYGVGYVDVDVERCETACKIFQIPGVNSVQ